MKTVNVIVKTNRQKFSMVCDLIDHGLCGETKRLRLVVPLEFFRHSDIISVVDKSTGHAKLLLICQIVRKNHSQSNFSLVYYICVKNISQISVGLIAFTWDSNDLHIFPIKYSPVVGINILEIISAFYVTV